MREKKEVKKQGEKWYSEAEEEPASLSGFLVSAMSTVTSLVNNNNQEVVHPGNLDVKITTSIAQRTAALRKSSLGGNENRPAYSSRRSKSLGGVNTRSPNLSVNQLRRQSTFKGCGVCGLDVLETEAESHRGEHFHRECCRCCQCGRALLGTLNVAFDRLDGDDMLYCDETRRGVHNCLQLARIRGRHDSGAAEKEAASQRLSVHEIGLVCNAKKHAVEVLGSDLERIIGAQAPTCSRCGSIFAGTDRLIICGMVKTHEECPENPIIRQLTPEIAIDFAPTRLVLKLQTLVKKQCYTFFLTRAGAQPFISPTKATLLFTPDPKSVAPKKRKFQGGAALLRAIDEYGADIAQAVNTTLTNEGTKLSAVYEWEGSGLDWVLRCDLTVDSRKQTITLNDALLTIQKPLV